MTIAAGLAAVVLVLVTLPLVRLVASESFRIAFFREAPLVIAALVAYVGVVIALAVAVPWVLPFLAALAVLAFGARQLHARAAYGRARGWPPGRLEIPSFAPWIERDHFFAQQRRHGCPFKVNQVVRPMACFVGLPEAQEFLRTHDEALSSPPLWFGRFIAGGLMRHMPPVQHEALREVFRAAFGREIFVPLESVMAEGMRAELDRMARESASSAGAGVGPRPYIQRMMFSLWNRLFFGVAEDGPELARLKALFHVIDIRKPRFTSDARIHAAVAEIAAIVIARHAAARAEAGTAPSVLGAIARRHPQAVEDPSVMGNLIYEMHITWADLSGFLQWILWMLVAHPAWLERVRSERRAAASSIESDQESLAARIVSETLRLEQSEHVYRAAERDIAHEGMVIPRGWLVRLCVRESHRDPRVFRDPDVFDPDRFLDRTYTRREYSPFGHGRHACLGEPLARQVGRLFVEEVARLEWRTIVDGPVEQGSWRHWRPSSHWRVVARPT